MEKFSLCHRSCAANRPLMDGKEPSSINGAQKTAWRRAQGATQSLEASAQRQRRKPERFQVCVHACFGGLLHVSRPHAPASRRSLVSPLATPVVHTCGWAVNVSFSRHCGGMLGTASLKNHPSRRRSRLAYRHTTPSASAIPFSSLSTFGNGKLSMPRGRPDSTPWQALRTPHGRRAGCVRVTPAGASR